MNPNPDPGSPKPYGSDGSGFGSATLIPTKSTSLFLLYTHGRKIFPPLAWALEILYVLYALYSLHSKLITAEIPPPTNKQRVSLINFFQARQATFVWFAHRRVLPIENGQKIKTNWLFHWIRIRIRHFKWIRIREQGVDDQKLKNIYLEKIYLLVFMIKNCNCFFLCLLKGRPNSRRSLQSSKENIQHFKK